MSTVCLVSLPAPSTPSRQADANLLAEHIATDSRLPRLALRLLGDPNRVDDVVQDAYLQAFRASPASKGTPRSGHGSTGSSTTSASTSCVARVDRARCVTTTPWLRRRPTPATSASTTPTSGPDWAALSHDQRAAVALWTGTA